MDDSGSGEDRAVRVGCEGLLVTGAVEGGLEAEVEVEEEVVTAMVGWRREARLQRRSTTTKKKRIFF